MIVCNIEIDEEYYKYYWIFAAHRMEVFWNRYEGKSQPWTNDPILQKYKFTNAYRVLDRASQYLVKNVQYNQKWDDEDTVFRTLLFKIYNKIETWEYLQNELGELSWKTFDFQKYNDALKKYKAPIFGNAYMMCTNKKNLKIKKFTNYLLLLKEMMEGGLTNKLKACPKMKDVFELLKTYNMIGGFLAYQYTIDLNYSPVINFSENEFVEAGGGAKRGIKKCFKGVKNSFKDWDKIILWMTEHQEEEFKRLGLEFKNLFGRKLQAIDCQNLFCETDKFTRETVKNNEKELMSKIKNKFEYKEKPKIKYFFPPKWNLNDLL